MRKLSCLALVFALCLLSGCGPKEPAALERIQDSTVVKLECSQVPDADPLFLYHTGTMDVGSLRIVPSGDEFTEPWLYRFTYDPKEVVHDTNGDSVEIVVLFGAENLSVDGTTYTAEEGLAYSTLLDWAAAQYQYYAEESVEGP